MVKKKTFNILIILLIFLLSVTISVSAVQVKLNDRGREVIKVQKYLETLGYDVEADGIFGKSTEDAVKEFQKNNNLQVDGIAGESTQQEFEKQISEKVSYELYVVEKGDTLSEIADKKDLSVDKLKNFNNLSSVKIKPGQDLKIPRDKVIRADKNNSDKVDTKNKKKIYYKVRKGDTLSTIAARRNLPVEQIMDANNLNSDFIKAGQELVLPIDNEKASTNSKHNSTGENKTKNNNSSEQIVHKVQRGDALSTIARMYGTDINSIKRNNNLNGNRIFVGDKLIIKNYERGPFRLTRNSLIWPVNGRITSSFGWRTHPIKKTRLFHNGLDIAVPNGTAVRAAASGEVVHSGWINGFGYTVIIDHGKGIETLYAHNSRTTVAEGSMVNRGERIALSGNTGLSTGPHVHFGVLRNEKPLNPRDYLK